MLSFGVMTTFEKKKQFGGWNKKRWSEIRQFLDKAWRKEFEEDIKVELELFKGQEYHPTSEEIC